MKNVWSDKDYIVIKINIVKIFLIISFCTEICDDNFYVIYVMKFKLLHSTKLCKVMYIMWLNLVFFNYN